MRITDVYAPKSADRSAVTEEGRSETSWLARFCGPFFCFYLLLVWLPWCLIFFGVSFGWWFDVGQWSITHILRLPEHFVGSRLSVNYLTNYVSTAVFVLVSTALATMWLAVDRRGITYPIAYVCAFVLARFVLAGYMMGYGWIKVLPAQFGLMASGAGTDYLMSQVGQLPPSDLLWAFMEASRPYQVFAGLIELSGGLLLLTRRTTMLGAFISAAAMTNVLLMNIGYDVAVKFVAGQILLLAAFVAAPYVKGLGAVLARHAAERSPHVLTVGGSARWNRATRVAGVLVACSLVWWTYRAAEGTAADFASAPARAPLHGIWDVEEVTRDGVAVPLLITDRGLWRRLVLPWEGTDGGAMLVWMSDAVTRCRSRIDTRAKTLTIEPMPESTVMGSVRPMPQAPSRMFFKYTREPSDQLVLTGTDHDGRTVLIRLRRLDHSTYQLLAHRYGWQW
jgi:hypothetical protein